MKIQSLVTFNPPRAEEFPLVVTVGQPVNQRMVVSITPVVWHGQHWFDVWGVNTRLLRINARDVAQLGPEINDEKS